MLVKKLQFNRRLVQLNQKKSKPSEWSIKDMILRAGLTEQRGAKKSKINLFMRDKDIKVKVSQK